MSIVGELEHLFFEELTAQPGSVDREGTWTASGTAVTIKARFEGRVRMVRTNGGQEVASSVSAIVAGAPGFTPTTYRFTLPSRFTPNTNVVAVHVEHETDADGPCYEEVFFP
jgi:hypothetical protein